MHAAVILTNTATPEIHAMTQRAVDLLRRQKNQRVEVIVVESNTVVSEYTGAHVIKYDGIDFNYNRSMKQGVKEAMRLQPSAHYIMMCNNDIEPAPDCVEQLMWQNVDSCSPKDPNLDLHKQYSGVVFGYRTSYVLCGWFLAIKQHVIKQVGVDLLLPDELAFWYQDNWIADVLKHHGINHALVTGAHCVHLESKSWDLVKNVEAMTSGQKIFYDRLKQRYGI